MALLIHRILSSPGAEIRHPALISTSIRNRARACFDRREIGPEGGGPSFMTQRVSGLANLGDGISQIGLVATGARDSRWCCNSVTAILTRALGSESSLPTAALISRPLRAGAGARHGV